MWRTIGFEMLTCLLPLLLCELTVVCIEYYSVGAMYCC